MWLNLLVGDLIWTNPKKKKQTNKLPSFIDKFSNFMPYNNTHIKTSNFHDNFNEAHK